jgi:uncharacterized protein
VCAIGRLGPLNQRGYSGSVALASSAIGKSLREDRWRAALAAAVGLAAAAVHLTGLSRADRSLLAGGLLPGLVALAALAALGRCDLRSLGLVARPQPGWMYWVKTTALLGLIVAGFVVLAIAVLSLAGVALTMQRLAPEHFWHWARQACIDAPLAEESVYRLALVTGVVALTGPRIAIAISGAIFAALHFVYGNPSPDNFIGGFVLSWAYLRSGTILVPIALHALGNLCVGLVALAAYYY